MSAKPFEVIVLGATGFTGRQAVRALLHRAASRPLRWAVAGRNADKLRALVHDAVPAPAAQPGIVLADVSDLASLQTLAGQTDVLLNLAGPYALHGEAVVQACIAHGTHHLDLTGETFWVQQLIARQHAPAQAAQVKVIVGCGYESMPFDLATLWAAHRVREHFKQPCREVKLVLSLTGKRIKRLQDAVSGGTVGSLQTMLEHDHTDCVRNPACLLPLDAPNAPEVARRNAYHLAPRFDADVGCVVAPTIPAPFVNPPIVLRTQALLAAAAGAGQGGAESLLYSPDFRYVEAMSMASLVPSVSFLPKGSTLPLQWLAAAALAAPLANLSAALAGPLQFQRQGLRKLVAWLAPKPGAGPSDEVLDGTGYAFDIFATAADGQTLRGRMEAQGHLSGRSTPEMAVTAAVGLARGELGDTGQFGIVTPAAGLGIEAVAALREAGVEFSLVASA
jgi:short subunit dehydrogenase-like uncharacterized protein